MGNTAKKDARTANALERDEKALTFRKQGWSYDAIARELGYGARCHAYRAVKKRIMALRRECNEVAEDVRVIELTRLDALLAGLWEKAASGDPQAVDRALRIQERRAAYLGLDSPRLLKIELERELATHVERLKAGLAPDVYEQVLAILAGEHGSSATGDDATREGSVGDGGPDESGST
jgi:hypothetical protein